MLTIAGVAVRSRSSYPLLREENRAYGQFQAADAASAAVEPAIDTEVLLTAAPENHASPIFDSDISWWMQPEGDGYRISFRGKGVDRPHTVMCSDRATSHVQVYAEQLTPAPDLSTGITDPLHYPLDQILLMNHLALYALVEGALITIALFTKARQ